MIKSVQRFWITKPMWLGMLLIISVINLVACSNTSAPTPIPTNTPTAKSFSYLVTVQDTNTGEGIKNAKVIIEVSGQASLDGITDSNGDARFEISSDHSGRPGELVIKIDDQEKYRRIIDLFEDRLPKKVLLKIQSPEDENSTATAEAAIAIAAAEATNAAATAEASTATAAATADTPTPEPTDTQTVVPGNTPTPDPTDTPTGVPSNTPIPEPTDTPTTDPGGDQPSLVVADFNSCTGVNNLLGPMGAAYNPPNNRLIETYPAGTGNGCVVKLDYEIAHWAAFWIMLEGANLTPYNRLTFDIRADPEASLPPQAQMKIELKRSDNTEIAITYVSGITTEWQTRSVNLPDFGPVPLSSLTEMNELVFTFEANRSGPAGVVYLDNIAFEPWQ